MKESYLNKKEKKDFNGNSSNSVDLIFPPLNQNLEVNNNSNLNYSFNIMRTSSSFNEENKMYMSEKKNDNFLYGHDFSLLEKPSRIGSTRICLFINNYPIISIGKNILVPLLLLLFECLIYIFIWHYFFHYSGYLLKKIFNYCFLIYLISHILSIILNPGIPSIEYNKKIKNDLRENKINDLDTSICKICNLSFRLRDKVEHCNKCNICYYECDHHCIWIGHCIGKYNRYIFGVFAFTSINFIIVCLVMVFLRILQLFIK